LSALRLPEAIFCPAAKPGVNFGQPKAKHTEPIWVLCLTFFCKSCFSKKTCYTEYRAQHRKVWSNMKILTRKVTTAKSSEDAMQILKSSAHCFPKSKFEENRFSICCAKRKFNRLSFMQIKGNWNQLEDHTSVSLEIHADPCFFIGSAFVLSGTVALILGSLLGIATILFGLIGCGISLGRGSELLDLLEHKLTR